MQTVLYMVVTGDSHGNRDILVKDHMDDASVQLVRNDAKHAADHLPAVSRSGKYRVRIIGELREDPTATALGEIDATEDIVRLGVLKHREPLLDLHTDYAGLVTLQKHASDHAINLSLQSLIKKLLAGKN